MDAKVRRQVEMGKRALLFSREHPDPSRGYQTSVGRLAGLVEVAEQLLRQQQQGAIDVHAAAMRKVDLRRKMKLVHLPHMASAAQAASREATELPLKFVFPPNARSFRAFRAAAGLMLANAEEHKELLGRYGLDDVVVQDMAESLAEFDEATARVTRGRMAHVGARAELRVIGREILVTVKILNGSNRLRFATDSEALAAWNSARRVDRVNRTEGAEQGGGAEAAEGPGLEPAA
jgi:hypothetical protein